LLTRLVYPQREYGLPCIYILILFGILNYEKSILLRENNVFDIFPALVFQTRFSLAPVQLEAHSILNFTVAECTIQTGFLLLLPERNEFILTMQQLLPSKNMHRGRALKKGKRNVKFFNLNIPGKKGLQSHKTT
jgi:hypothetical protein